MGKPHADCTATGFGVAASTRPRIGAQARAQGAANAPTIRPAAARPWALARAPRFASWSWRRPHPRCQAERPTRVGACRRRAGWARCHAVATSLPKVVTAFLW